MCNGEVGDFVMVYCNDNVDPLTECFYKQNSILHEYLFYCRLKP